MDKKIYPKCTRGELVTHPKKLKSKHHVSLTKYSGTNEIIEQIKLSVELSLHAGSLINTEK